LSGSPRKRHFHRSSYGGGSSAPGGASSIGSSESDEDRYLCSLVGNAVNFDELQQYLESQPDLEVTTVIDGSGFTLLHLAAYRNSLKFTKLLVDHAIKLIPLRTIGNLHSRAALIEKTRREREFKYWLNREVESEEAFTALHYASYHGNIKIIKFLMEKGADPLLSSNRLINPVHVSA
jgi:ankyrin repeat protein